MPRVPIVAPDRRCFAEDRQRWMQAWTTSWQNQSSLQMLRSILMQHLLQHPEGIADIAVTSFGEGVPDRCCQS